MRHAKLQRMIDLSWIQRKIGNKTKRRRENTLHVIYVYMCVFFCRRQDMDMTHRKVLFIKKTGFEEGCSERGSWNTKKPTHPKVEATNTCLLEWKEENIDKFSHSRTISHHRHRQCSVIDLKVAHSRELYLCTQRLEKEWRPGFTDVSYYI